MDSIFLKLSYYVIISLSFIKIVMLNLCFVTSNKFFIIIENKHFKFTNFDTFYLFFHKINQSKP